MRERLVDLAIACLRDGRENDSLVGATDSMNDRFIRVYKDY